MQSRQDALKPRIDSRYLGKEYMATLGCVGVCCCCCWLMTSTKVGCCFDVNDDIGDVSYDGGIKSIPGKLLAFGEILETHAEPFVERVDRN